MARDLVMPGGMLVLGVITAAHVPAHQTQAQVHPFIPGLQAVLTPLRAGRDITDLILVRAFVTS